MVGIWVMLDKGGTGDAFRFCRMGQLNHKIQYNICLFSSSRRTVLALQLCSDLLVLVCDSSYGGSNADGMAGSCRMSRASWATSPTPRPGGHVLCAAGTQWIEEAQWRSGSRYVRCAGIVLLDRLHGSAIAGQTWVPW